MFSWYILIAGELKTQIADTNPSFIVTADGDVCSRVLEACYHQTCVKVGYRFFDQYKPRLFQPTSVLKLCDMMLCGILSFSSFPLKHQIIATYISNS